MEKFPIQQLIRIIKAYPTSSHQQQANLYRATGFITGVSTDSRTTNVGDCFFAIPGENFDGHNFLTEAFAKGAICAVVNKNSKCKIKNSKFRYPLLKVDNTIKALGDFAREYRHTSRFKVVAITGSVGKTTVRQIAYHVLSQYFRVFSAPKNFNNYIGLPLTLLYANPDHQIVIAELGANHPGEIAYLTRIAQPDIAVITNVYPVHLEGFGDLQTIAREKLSISKGLKNDGILIINADLARQQINTISKLIQQGGRVVTFGKSNTCDYYVQNITYDGFGSSFTINDSRIFLPLAGEGNVENALVAWAICSQFGLTIQDFAQAIKTIRPVCGRAEVLQIGTLTVINDCYNANPASMKNALDILARVATKRKTSIKLNHKDIQKQETARLVFICGEMAELGQQSQLLHAQLGVDIAKAKVQLLLAIGKFAKIIAEEKKKNAQYHLQIECFEDTISVCNSLQNFIKDYDIILVKGSRTAKLEMAVEKLKELFS